MLRHTRNYLFALTTLSLLGCSRSNSQVPIPTSKKSSQSHITPNTLSIEGDFDGDGKEDTIRQFIADSTGKPVTELINYSSYEEALKHFDKHNLHVQLNMNDTDTKIDTGISSGLYSLINMGDTNNDNKDEIAFVPVLMDFSNLNTCHIYALCDNQWKEVKSFKLLENAFDYIGDSEPVFNEIPGYLQKENNQWMYWDYSLAEEVADEDFGKMKKLKTPKCN